MGREWNNHCHHVVVWSFEHYDREYNDVGDDATNFTKVFSSGFDNTLASRGRKILVNHFAVLCHFKYTENNKVISVDES